MASVLAQEGLEVHRHDENKPVSYWVVGERSTGTNLAYDLISKNIEFRPYMSISWKHGIPYTRSYPRRHLLIVTFRRADDWARSMFAKPWEAHPKLFDLDFHKFIRHPWWSISSQGRGMEFKEAVHSENDLRNIPLDLDRHPIEGRPFRNIFEMRTVKQSVWLNMHRRISNVVYVQLECLRKSPENFIDQISKSFDLQRRGKFEPVDFHHGGNRFWHDRKANVPNSLSEEDYRFMVSQLSLETERHIGYEYLQN